jgi:hypothetical protein
LIVLAPLGLHVASGIALRIYRRRQNVQWYGAESREDRRKIPWPRVSGTSLLGYALLPAAAAHFFVNRALPVKLDGGSSGVGLAYVAHGFAKHPAVAYTAYAGLISLGVLHFVWGWAKWLGFSPETAHGVNDVERRQVKKRRWYSINGVAVAVAGLWMAGVFGVIARGGAALGYRAKHFDKLFEQVPLIGGWLVK